ncbi:MAG: HPr family phosphocarrier protein [Thermodesulfobacteriota bacterium]|nr:HPr family phosphocarrier protein [Thermodesulfobacteriota bacterium]
MYTLSRDVVIINELGLHARSAARIAKLAQNASSKVWLVKGKERVDASSVIDILSLACLKGSKITLKIDEESDIDILNEIIELIKKGFGE